MIRSLVPADATEVLATVKMAFSDAGRDGEEELAVVRGTWAARSLASRVELVAEESAQVVGHILAATGSVEGAPIDVAGIAPVGVAPEWQGRGVGRSLMERLIAEAKSSTWLALVLLGDPAFYGRFGFEAAGPLGLVYPPAGRDSPHFLVLPLRPLARTIRGAFRYCWE